MKQFEAWLVFTRNFHSFMPVTFIMLLEGIFILVEFLLVLIYYSFKLPVTLGDLFICGISEFMVFL